ncbi:trehalose-phosphatase [Puccinia sorghi]|uniref:Trehalose 6-phosphate phosphatase n=1 Tax=Puccinia sorghi TaxID=27349 RepID=A0A0L6UWC4_9BASI|nr:trehalose-phosphatase [Puccinia sorghi]
MVICLQVTTARSVAMDSAALPPGTSDAQQQSWAAETLKMTNCVIGGRAGLFDNPYWLDNNTPDCVDERGMAATYSCGNNPQPDIRHMLVGFIMVLVLGWRNTCRARSTTGALTLVGLFNGSAQAAGIRNDRLFGQGQVFEPTQDLVGEPSDSARQVQDVNHCYEADFSLFFPGKTLIALDNDGVLSPKHATKDQKQSARDLLKKLGCIPNIEVWVVSARSLSSLRFKYSGIPGVNLAAEHGTMLLPYGQSEQTVVIDGMSQIREEVIRIAERYNQMEMFVFDTQNVVAFKYNENWHGTEYADAALLELQRTLPSHIPLRQEAEKAYGEIKDPRIEKANFVAKLLQSGRFNSGIAIGDQITDEGMLRAMNKYQFHSVIVSRDSSQETRAKNKLNDVEEVHQLLRQLTIVKHEMAAVRRSDNSEGESRVKIWEKQHRAEQEEEERKKN